MKKLIRSSLVLISIVLAGCVHNKKSFVTLEFNGGTYQGSSSVELVINSGAEMYISARPERSDGVFIGWTRMKDTPSTLIKSSYITPTLEKEVYWAYYLKEHKVTFDTNGGSPVPGRIGDYTVYINDSYTITSSKVPPSPTRQNYTFLGWTTKKDSFDDVAIQSDGSGANDYVVTGPTTLYALWTNKVNLTFDLTFGRSKNTAHGSVKTYQANSGDLLDASWYSGDNMPYSYIDSTSPIFAGGLDFIGFTTEKNKPSTLIDLSKWRVPTTDKPVVLYAYWFPNMKNVPGGTVKTGNVWSNDTGRGDVYARATNDYNMPCTSSDRKGLSKLKGVTNRIGKKDGVAFSVAEHFVTAGLWYAVTKGNKITLTTTGSLPAGTIDPSGTFELSSTHGKSSSSSTAPSTDPTAPIVGRTWYDAVVFCNMLTQLVYGSTSDCYYNIESIEAKTSPCNYISNITFGEPMFFPSNRGFRLMDTAEWEWAARGGVPNNSVTASMNAGQIEKMNYTWDYSFPGYNRLKGDYVIANVSVPSLNWYDGLGHVDTSFDPLDDAYTQTLSGLASNSSGALQSVSKVNNPNSLGLYNMTGLANTWLDMNFEESGTKYSFLCGGSYSDTEALPLSIYSIGKKASSATIGNTTQSIRVCSSAAVPEFKFK